MKWLTILWELMRDVVLTGLGVWIIWKQAESAAPSAELLAVALTCIVPAARSAVTTVLSGPGSSSSASRPHAEPPPPSLPASPSEPTHER